MRWFRFVVLIIMAAVLQFGLLEVFSVSSLRIKPDLLLVLLVFFAIYCDISDAIIASFVIGFAADLIGSAMGVYMISFGFFGTLLAYLHRIVAIRKMPYQCLAIFITGVLTGMLAFLLTMLVRQSAGTNVFGVLVGTSLYSAIVGPFFFLPTMWLMRIKTYRFGK